MVIERSQSDLGAPSLQVEGLRIWIHGYQFPDATDYWDGNWLRVTVHCGADGANVWVAGALLRNDDLLRWADACEALRSGTTAMADLSPLEPELAISVRPKDDLGHLLLTVSITPDHLSQRHTFDFDIDHTWLVELSRACKRVVHEYPVRGENESRRV